MALANLEELFLKKMNDLYSLQKHPYKDAADVHPIIVYAPNDPNRPQGIGNTDRTVPVGAVLADQKRFAKLLTSPAGLKFFIKQELLQTGNAISETRVIDPLFINKNLAPYVHSKRQLFDQTDIIVNDPDRSPATTPEVGLAGRLQRETGATAIQHIFGRKTARQTLLDVLGSSQIGQTIAGLMHVTNGTYEVNQRPELDIDGRWYSGILYTGRKPLINRELDILIDALGAVGVGASIIGLPNVFAGLRGSTPLPATSNFSTQGTDPLGTMPYFNPDIPGVESAGRYVQVHSTREPPIRLDTFVPEKLQKVIDIGLSTVVRNLLGIPINKSSSILSYRPTISIGPEIAVDQEGEVAKLSKKERSMRQRYEQPTDPTTVLSAESRARIVSLKDSLDNQFKPLDQRLSWHTTSTYGELYRKLQWKGGITPFDASRFRDFENEGDYHSYHQSITQGGTLGYSSDLLNHPENVEISGTTLPTREDFPQDYVDVHIVDRTNGRIIPFRAHLFNLNESVDTEYTTTRYIGRIERNIIYTGATRTLRFSLYLHAWSPDELQSVWRKVNILTGLAFPAAYSSDGFLVPGIVELTIGNIYKNQPGYIQSINHTIEDGTTWELKPDNQVPHTIKVDITFAVIERFAMHARSRFYGYGFGKPITTGAVFGNPITSGVA